jgi:hypothetical protein
MKDSITNARLQFADASRSVNSGQEIRIEYLRDAI